MVTGRRPFEGESDYSIMAAHLQQAPRRRLHFDASLPQALNDVIMMSIAKDPGQRFQSADAFRLALESVGKGLGIGAASASAASGTQVFNRPAPPPPAPPAPPSARQRAATVLEGGPSQAGTPGMPPPAIAMPMPPPAPPRQGPSQPHMQSMPQPPNPPFGAQPQFAAPQYAQMPPVQAQAQTGHSNRGLYMVLGSVVTIGILAGAAFYVPKFLKARANGETAQVEQVQTPVKPVQPVPQQQTVGQAGPAPAPIPQQSVTQAPVPQTPAPQTPVSPEPSRPVPGRQQAATKPQRQLQAYAPPVAPPVPQNPPTPIQPTLVAPPPQEPLPQPTVANPPVNPGAGLEELNHRKMLMHARVDAINANMTKLEQDQRSMGLGMNGELVARQHRMVFYLETADGAMRKGNVEQARSSLNNAERELEKLEEHFGR